MFFLVVYALLGLAQPRKALTLNHISELIKNGVTPNRIARLVEENGVGFELDDLALRRLKQDGANETVLSAVKKMSARYAEEKQQKRQQEEEAGLKREEEVKRREQDKRRADEEKRRQAEAERERQDAAQRQQAKSEAFYEGKTIRLVTGFPVGSTSDLIARATAQHWGKHIPGYPIIIVENMPALGSIVAANHVYNVAKPDGLTLGS